MNSSSLPIATGADFADVSTQEHEKSNNFTIADYYRRSMNMAPPPLYPLSNDHSLPTPEEAINWSFIRGVPTRKSKKLCILLASIAGLSMVLGLSVGLALGSDLRTSNLTLDSTDRFANAKNILTLASISTKKDLDTEGSPQFLALQWITNDDQRQLNIPETILDVDGEDSYEFVQRYVLAVLYYATQGASWKNARISHFLQSDSECSWNVTLSVSQIFNDGGKTEMHLGVRCNEDGRINSIFMPDNHMVGSLPSELGHLISMEHFSLFGNSLSGSLPDSLGQWQQLNILDLANNTLIGTLGSWFSFPNLKYLDLATNGFSGQLPSFDWAKNMVEASLYDNRFEGSVDVFTEATLLEKLYLQNNQLSGSIGDATLTRQFKPLQQLDVSNNQLTGSFPVHFYDFGVVDLHNNSLSGPLPEVQISGLPLIYLSLYLNDFSGSIPTTLGLLDSLQHLDLSHNTFSGELPNVFDQLVNLHYLFLHNNNFDAGMVVDFWRLKSLKELSLAATNRTGRIPHWMGSYLTDLVLLDLHDNHLTGFIPSQLAKLTELRFLFLNDNLLNGTLPKAFSEMYALEMFTLQRNNLTSHSDGSENPLCQHSKPLMYFTLDCQPPAAEINCECCVVETQCCADTNVSCNAWTISPSMDGEYTRTSYMFNENLEFNLVGSEPVN